MNAPSNNSGARPSRTAPGEVAETLAWPVLASLPRVGDQRAPQRAAISLDATIAHAGERAGDLPALRMATLADAPQDFEPLASTPPAGRGTLGFRTFIDQPHLAVRGFEWPLAGEVHAAAEPAPSVTLSSTHRRIDAGNPRQVAPKTACASPGTTAQGSQSLSARVFRLHAATAPHAGIIMTLALAASVGLLCWFTMGRPKATHYDHSLDDRGGWPAETATSLLPEGAAGVSAASDQFVSEFAWQAAPTGEKANAPEPATAKSGHDQSPSPPAAAASNDVATLSAPKLDLNGPPGTSTVAGAVSASPSPTDKVATAESAPTAPETTTAAPAAAAASTSTASIEGPAAAKSPEPITPTPHPHGFPTTPYGAFNYFAAPAPATADAAAADQSSVASQASAAPAAPR